MTHCHYTVFLAKLTVSFICITTCLRCFCSFFFLNWIKRIGWMLWQRDPTLVQHLLLWLWDVLKVSTLPTNNPMEMVEVRWKCWNSVSKLLLNSSHISNTHCSSRTCFPLISFSDYSVDWWAVWWAGCLCVFVPWVIFVLWVKARDATDSNK